MDLKEFRKSKKLTQIEAARYVNIPLRTYKNYENDKSKGGGIKYSYIVDKLSEIGFFDENHGMLTIEDIANLRRKLKL
ncbi:helix-turn-helix transcriptional regulator [Mycoplasmatota bacterium WC30]